MPAHHRVLNEGKDELARLELFNNLPACAHGGRIGTEH